jgi:hypothetical protein
MPYFMVIACLSTEFRITFTGHVIPAVIVVGATPGPIRAPHAASRRVTIRFRLRVKAERDIVVVAKRGPRVVVLVPHAASRRVTIRFRLDVIAERDILPFRAEFLVSPGVPLPALGRIVDTVFAACRLVAPLEDVAIIARRSATRNIPIRIITSQEKITAIALPAVGRRG